MLVSLGDDPRDATEPDHQETLIALKIEEDDLKRLWNYLNGAPWPYTHSNKEIDEEGDRWMLLQDEIKRGK